MFNELRELSMEIFIELNKKLNSDKRFEAIYLSEGGTIKEIENKILFSSGQEDKLEDISIEMCFWSRNKVTNFKEKRVFLFDIKNFKSFEYFKNEYLTIIGEEEIEEK